MAFYDDDIRKPVPNNVTIQFIECTAIEDQGQVPVLRL